MSLFNGNGGSVVDRLIKAGTIRQVQIPYSAGTLTNTSLRLGKQ